MASGHRPPMWTTWRITRVTGKSSVTGPTCKVSAIAATAAKPRRNCGKTERKQSGENRADAGTLGRPGAAQVMRGCAAGNLLRPSPRGQKVSNRPRKDRGLRLTRKKFPIANQRAAQPLLLRSPGAGRTGMRSTFSALLSPPSFGRVGRCADPIRRQMRWKRPKCSGRGEAAAPGVRIPLPAPNRVGFRHITYFRPSAGWLGDTHPSWNPFLLGRVAAQLILLAAIRQRAGERRPICPDPDYPPMLSKSGAAST